MSQMLSAIVILLAFTGSAVAQGPPAAANAPGRGGFTPVVIGPQAPVPREVAIPAPNVLRDGADQ